MIPALQDQPVEIQDAFNWADYLLVALAVSDELHRVERTNRSCGKLPAS